MSFVSSKSVGKVYRHARVTNERIDIPNQKRSVGRLAIRSNCIETETIVERIFPLKRANCCYESTILSKSRGGQTLSPRIFHQFLIDEKDCVSVPRWDISRRLERTTSCSKRACCCSNNPCLRTSMSNDAEPSNCLWNALKGETRSWEAGMRLL